LKVCVIGTGYVGLVAGVCFAESGNDVICVDIDKDKIERLKKSISPIYEPGLKELLKRNISEGRLTFTTDLKRAVRASLINFIAVGTPQDDDGSANLEYVYDVAKKIGKYMDTYKIIVDKSTVPVGTADKVKKIISENTSHKFDVVSNPEFMKEGAAIDDFMKPDRVIIGTNSKKAVTLMSDLYSPFVRTGKPIITMGIRDAELTKYASNSILALRISFINEIANLCEKVGADVKNVRKGIGTDTRIGPYFLFPGVGYGGSCFPKDVQAIVKTAELKGYDFKTLRAAEAVNKEQKTLLARKILKHFKGNIKGKNIAVLGLAFKPNTDDMREAPSIDIINMLLNNGAKVTAFDPEAMANSKPIFKRSIKFARNVYDCIKDADALAIVTEWNEFRRPDFDKIKKLLKTPIIFDGRNVFDPKTMKRLGFKYYGIGRKV
jgi:UDPglucose 6-dehydrogenase